ncbi:MAG: DNA topoisomerase 3 [Bacillota bacterium]
MPAAHKPLIVAEKPAAARAIAGALGGFAPGRGYLESAHFVLTWAIGHLVELSEPDEYDPRWKRWTLDLLPVLPGTFRTRVVPRTRAQFETIARLARSAPELVNACDAGREGELIFRHIYQALGLTVPVRRLWISSLTREAIRKGFSALAPQSQYDLLYESARCRAQGDWLVGMNATRAFTCRWGELFPVGRVQTPTLALLVQREREIEAFVPERYWEVWAQFTAAGHRHYQGQWFGPEGDRLSDVTQAEAVAARVAKRPGVVESVEVKATSERPPQLYDLTSLQRDANYRLGLTAGATLKAAQALYEKQLITYPRTDSRYLPRDLLRELPAIVRAIGVQEAYRAAVAGAQLELVHPGNRRVVNDARVTDHHAILPTAGKPAAGSGPEARVYDLVIRRFLAQFYPEARYQDTEVITRVGACPDRFRSRGRHVLAWGWRALEPASEGPGSLPPLDLGEEVMNSTVETREKMTQAPRRYSEGALLSAMEWAGKELDDEGLREAMKSRGLGTPATRAAIIDRLKEVGYIVVDGKTLVPTAKARRLVALAELAGAGVLLSAELTGEWEMRIAGIQSGDYEPARFMDEIGQLAVQVVDWVRQAPQEPAPAPVVCPRCGGLVNKGKREWGCTGADCTLAVPGYFCGRVLDRSLVEKLLQDGRSPLVSGFRSPRTGRAFSAFLVLKDTGVALEFPKRKGRKKPAGRKGRSGRGTRAASERNTTVR